MKKLYKLFIALAFLGLSAGASAQTCIDYTDLTNTSIVQAEYGFWDSPTLTINAGLVDYGYDNWLSRHTVHSVLEYDTVTLGGLRTIPDGALASVRLGNKGNYSEWEGLTYTFAVDSVSPILLFKYATVVEAPGHDESAGIGNADPKITLEILDASNQIISQILFSSYQGILDYNNGDTTWHKITEEELIDAGLRFPMVNTGTGTRELFGDIYWKDWTNVGVNLIHPIDLRGQTIKVRIRNFDCAYSGHFGYSYFTLNCANVTYYSAEICNGDSYTDSNFTNLTLPDTYSITFQNSNGEDSIVMLNLFVNQPSDTTIIYDTICANLLPYAFNGFIENITGIYTLTLQNINGCDSVITLHLFVEENCIDWTFENDTLTISGIGAMPDYDITNPQHISNKNLRSSSEIAETSAPWNELADEILHIVIGEGITRVGNYAFYNCVNALSAELASTVGEIGEYAFAQCGSLEEIIIHNENGIDVDETAFENVNTSQIKLVVPEGSEDNYNNDDIWGEFIIGEESNIDEILANSISIFPNPAKELLTINNGQLTINNLEICDISGKTLISLQPLNYLNPTINVANLSSGIYLLKIHTDKGIKTERFVKK